VFAKTMYASDLISLGENADFIILFYLEFKFNRKSFLLYEGVDNLNIIYLLFLMEITIKRYVHIHCIPVIESGIFSLQTGNSFLQTGNCLFLFHLLNSLYFKFAFLNPSYSNFEMLVKKAKAISQ
jgi:hypothetical protein